MHFNTAIKIFILSCTQHKPFPMTEQYRMHFLPKYPEWHNNPLYLSNEEIANPDKVLAEFFTYYDLRNIRTFLKLWLQAALRTNEVLDMDYLTLHDHMIKLAEAAWVLHTTASKAE